MNSFFKIALDWVYGTHRVLSKNFPRLNLCGHPDAEIQDFCSHLLTLLRLSAEYNQHEVESSIHDMYSYWKNRVLAASNYDLEWNIVGKTPLPQQLINSLLHNSSLGSDQMFRYVEIYNYDPIIVLSIMDFMSDNPTLKLKSNNPLAISILSQFQDRLKELIINAEKIEYHMPYLPAKYIKQSSPAWQITVAGQYHLNYPVALFINERFLELSTIVSLVSRMEAVMEIKSAA